MKKLRNLQIVTLNAKILKAKVVKFGTSAHVIVPKKLADKEVSIIIFEEDLKD